MSFWIRAVLATLWAWLKAALLLALLAVVAIAAAIALGWAFFYHERATEVAIVLLMVASAVLLAWIFVGDVREAHERILCRARLEEADRERGEE